MNATKRVVFLNGPRVYLRPPRESDLTLFVQWMNDPECRKYLQSHLPMLEADEKGYLERAFSGKPNNINLVIVLKENDQPIGNHGLHLGNSKDKVGTTGTLIGEKASWGKGYGPEAKMLMLEYAFNTLNVRKIYSFVYGPNARSKRSNEKCGYKIEATLPQDTYIDGKYVEKHIYAVYRSDWEPLWEQFIDRNPRPWHSAS